MGYLRGKFGVEFSPERKNEESPTAVIAVVVLVVLVAAVSFALTVRNRFRAVKELETGMREPEGELVRPVQFSGISCGDVFKVSDVVDLRDRPAKVRSLLMRLEHAQETNDIEMAVETVEQLRALPGKPALDLDDRLAYYLGALNRQLLTSCRSSKWLVAVKVGPDMALSRISKEHGATLASTLMLNPDVRPDGNFTGRVVYVLNHPRFRLVVSRRSCRADLYINNRFFCRYGLLAAVRAEAGDYQLTAGFRAFARNRGIVLAEADRDELEALLPPGINVLVTESDL